MGAEVFGRWSTQATQLLPELVEKVWSGGLQAQLLFSSLNLCLSNGLNAARFIYGIYTNEPAELSFFSDAQALDSLVRDVYSPIVP